MSETPTAYGTTRDRGATVSYAEIERAARSLMSTGERPTVEAVRKTLRRGSPNHIATCMQQFWKNQAALNAGDPIALTRLPPELADAAVAQWEQALRLALQTAKVEDSAARAHLEELRRDTEIRARSVELREKEWDMAARVRERALIDAREHVNVLMKELAIDRAELRTRDARIADLESQVEEHQRQLATVIARALAKNRVPAVKKPTRKLRAKPKRRIRLKKRVPSKPTSRTAKRKSHGQRQ
jgi:plasmid replication DNA-binding protein KfrA